ncbi:hypothetical protein [Streptomyces sp. H27-C3]|uniref:hypothetical protein n=1 Tax=Streptomyces sp. H27-C3 TaxID=3046305 RepID=UPI0024B8C55A|nr:hypothetical protein [Streptomyces sp. H27-C3]MDJ0460688.1 hypothetical protein [Streptomyces sp. H27-C3]
MSRDNSDEAYVIDLCNAVLGEQALTQHRFDWLLGDPGVGGRQVKLPVDGYWPGRQLVVEYRELQHDQPVAHFDKPDRLTGNGLPRSDLVGPRGRRCPAALSPRSLPGHADAAAGAVRAVGPRRRRTAQFAASLVCSDA